MAVPLGSTGGVGGIGVHPVSARVNVATSGAPEVWRGRQNET
jgi:hypothetical protein